MNFDDLKSKAVRGAGVNFTAQLVGFLFHLAGVVVLARLLGPRDFGLVAMVTVLSLWFMNFGLNGFTEFIIQKENLAVEEINAIFWLHNIIAGLLALVLMAMGYFLVDFYSEPALWGIAAAMSTSIILGALATCHLALLKRDLRFTAFAIIELAAVILSVIFAVGAAVVGVGYWAVVIRQLGLSLVMMFGAWMSCSWRPGAPARLSLAFPGLKYAVKVYLNFSLGYVRSGIDKVLLGKFSGSALLGQYERASQLSSLPANQLLAPLNGVALAALSRLVNDRRSYIVFFTKAVGMVAFLGTYAALLLTLISDDLIGLLLGADWVYAGKIVMVLGPGIAGMLVYSTHSWLHLSMGTPDRWLKWNIVSTIVTVGAFVAVAPYGPIAMAIAFSTVSILLVIPALWYAGRPLRIELKTMVATFWPYFVSAGIVGASWMFASTRWPLLKETLARVGRIERIIIVAGAVSILYLILVVIIDRGLRSFREVGSFVKIFFMRRSGVKDFPKW